MVLKKYPSATHDEQIACASIDNSSMLRSSVFARAIISIFSQPALRVCVSATRLAESDLAAGMKGLRVLMDQATMYDAERWLEIAEVMRFDAPAIESEKSAAIIEAEVTEKASAAPIEPEVIELQLVEPRSARVLSIAELRQKLGIEQRAPLAAPSPPADGRPRIVRRRENDAMPQMAAG